MPTKNNTIQAGRCHHMSERDCGRSHNFRWPRQPAHSNRNRGADIKQL